MVVIVFLNPYTHMNPIQALQKRGGKGIIYSLLANYPSFDRCLQLIDELVKSGMTALELIVPSVKPYLDSQEIQAAHRHVLREGYQSTDLIVILHHIKKKHPHLPVFLKGYEESFHNHMFHLNAFLYDGIICLDGKVHVLGVPQIPLINNEEELRYPSWTEWFVYLTSNHKSNGQAQGEAFERPLQKLKEQKDSTVYVGIGVGNARDIQRILSHGADGIIIASELIKRATEETYSRLRWLRENEQMLLSFA
jgi:tryptophan synthase alpha subunit